MRWAAAIGVFVHLVGCDRGQAELAEEDVHDGDDVAAGGSADAQMSSADLAVVAPAAPDPGPEPSAGEDAAGGAPADAAGGGADAVTTGDAGAVDARGADIAGPPSDAAAPGACDLALAGARFDGSVRPYIPTCYTCHDMTAPAGLLKAPGPPWYHPEDTDAVVAFLLDNELVDPAEPSQSVFLLKPLDQPWGGTNHTGGELIFGGTVEYRGFLTFLEAAAPCVPVGHAL